VGLGAVAAVGLEGTLRHFVWTPADLFAGCNSLQVYANPERAAKKCGYLASGKVLLCRPENTDLDDENRSSQGMVQLDFLSLDPLKQAWISVLLSNPLTKDEFPFIWVAVGFTLSFFVAKGR
jgi:hypothetical protein